MCSISLRICTRIITVSVAYRDVLWFMYRCCISLYQSDVRVSDSGSRIVIVSLSYRVTRIRVNCILVVSLSVSVSQIRENGVTDIAMIHSDTAPICHRDLSDMRPIPHRDTYRDTM